MKKTFQPFNQIFFSANTLLFPISREFFRNRSIDHKFSTFFTEIFDNWKPSIVSIIVEMMKYLIEFVRNLEEIIRDSNTSKIMKISIQNYFYSLLDELIIICIRISFKILLSDIRTRIHKEQ